MVTSRQGIGSCSISTGRNRNQEGPTRLARQGNQSLDLAWETIWASGTSMSNTAPGGSIIGSIKAWLHARESALHTTGLWLTQFHPATWDQKRATSRTPDDYSNAFAGILRWHFRTCGAEFVQLLVCLVSSQETKKTHRGAKGSAGRYVALAPYGRRGGRSGGSSSRHTRHGSGCTQPEITRQVSTGHSLASPSALALPSGRWSPSKLDTALILKFLPAAGAHAEAGGKSPGVMQVCCLR
jgi:hypothetical protein